LRSCLLLPGRSDPVAFSQIGGFSNDGAFDPAAIDVIRRSLKELGILPAVPEAKSIYNDRFVPVRF
jgi:hypothetical protein